MITSILYLEVALLLTLSFLNYRARRRNSKALARLAIHTLTRSSQLPRPTRLLSLTSRLFTYADSRAELLAEGLRQLADLTAHYADTVAIAAREGNQFAPPLVTGAYADRIRSRLTHLFATLLDDEYQIRFWGSQHTAHESFIALGIERWLTIPCRNGDHTVAAIWIGLKRGTLDMPLETLHELEFLGESFASALGAALMIRERQRAGEHSNTSLLAFSHDILAPNTNALLMVRELQSGAVGASQNELLSGIEESLLRQFELISSALNLDRRGSIVSPVALPLAPLVDRLLSEYSVAATAGGIEFQNMVPPTHAVRADAQQLLRILDNLISNAVRHSQSHRVTVCSRQIASMIQISVIDNGRGIPAELRPKLFTRLTASGQSIGFGIGLAGARALAHQNQGTLEFREAAHGGACFILTLPAAECVTPQRFQSALIVDDAPAVCRTIVRYLTGVIPELHTAATVDEAEKELATQKPELLITDWRIGDRYAESLLERFAKENPHGRLSVLLTGAAEPHSFERLRSRYHTRIVSKPLNRESLLAAVFAPSITHPSHIAPYQPIETVSYSFGSDLAARKTEENSRSSE